MSSSPKPGVDDPYPKDSAIEENEGLLSGKPEVREEEQDSRPSSHHLRNSVIAFGVLVLFAFLLRLFTYSPSSHDSDKGDVDSSDDLDFSKTGGMRSNGTHLFRKTVILVSIDGLRADYLDRGLTPHLFDISQVGLRAKYMQPIFPTITFPNHWSILTGLYAESHGIVGNNFWDPLSNLEFMYSDPSRSLSSIWWGGEPIWEAVEKAGKKTANLMWIGPPELSSGVKPSYFVPWRNHVAMREKLDQIMNWVDLPIEERPQLIFAYEPSLDQAGHSKGPGSALVNATLAEVDQFAKDLHTSLAHRNLSSIVDIIFVSDHGMADTGHPEWIYLEDIIGLDGIADIEHEDGWPSMGLRFFHEEQAASYLQQLQKAAQDHPDKFDVYTPSSMPDRYHFSSNSRIAPIYIVPKLGYALSRTRDSGNVFVKGNHGYDNELPSMRAIFVADGPFTRHLTKKQWGSAYDRRKKPGFVMEGFRNVEVKSLVGKLLGVEVDPSTHNGTTGFWEKYL